MRFTNPNHTVRYSNCDDSDNSLWSIRKNNDGTYIIISKIGDQAMEALSGTPFGSVRVYSLDENKQSQKWSIVTLNGSTYFQNVSNNLCIYYYYNVLFGSPDVMLTKCSDKKSTYEPFNLRCVIQK